MSIPIKDFWKLVVEARLLPVDEARQLHGSFTQMPGAAQQSNALTLAEWLVASGVLTRYQTQLLLGGRAGPFVFGDYKICEPAAGKRLQGLFKATHIPSSHAVLLYFLSGAPTQDPRVWSGITRDAQSAAAAQHPHLSRLYELVDQGNYKFAVVEDLAGATIAERLAGRATVPGEACRIVRDAAIGLARLHELGLGHGSVRPANIWVADSGQVKLLQFPLARDPLAPPTFTLEAADYVAPEVIAGGGPLDPLADLYSLGCTLYELIAGRVPFPGGDMNQKLARHAQEMPEPLERLASVPPAVAQIVGYLMAKDSRGRYQAAAHVAEALGPLMTPLPTQPPGPAPTLAKYEQSLSRPKVNGAPPPAPQQRAAAAPPAMSHPGGTTAFATPQAPPIAPSRPQPVPANRPQPVPVSRPQPMPESPFAAPALNTGFGGGLATAAAPMAPTLGVKPQGVAPRTQPMAPPTELNTTPVVRPKKKSMGSDNLVIVGVASVAILAFVALLAWKTAGKSDPEPVAVVPEKPASMTDEDGADDEPIRPQPPRQTPPGGQQPASPSGKPPAAVASKPAPIQVDDDGQTLWVSPTAGQPLDLRYLPSGAQVIIALRPSDILANPEGAKMLAALGPGGTDVKVQVEAAIGMSLGSDPVEQIIIALIPQEAGPVKTAYVVRLREKIDEATLLGRWQNPMPPAEGKKFYHGATWAYYIPPDGGNQVFAVASPADMNDVVDASEPPALRKEMEKMLRDTDASRHFTLLANPSYVFTDGAELLGGNLEKLRKPLFDFLGDGVMAALLSFHLGENFFVEMRAFGALDEDPFRLANKYRDKLEKVPDDYEQYYVTLNPHPFGRFILTRFPQMIRSMAEFTRTGEENKQAVLRRYLPAAAGHNLVMGTELSLAETPGAGPAVAIGAGPKTPTTPAEALKQKISLSFPRDTLEKTMLMLGEEIKWEVVILGGDLQLEGITKNQSFGLDERDKPADEILRKVMMLANPDGKLVYVFKPKEPGGKDVIHITTRAAAAKRGDKLPPELEQK